MTAKLSLRGVAPSLLVAAAWFVAGLAVSRLLYEWRFPEWAALGRPGAALALGVVAAAVGWLVGRWRGPAAVVAALPLLVNLLWLADPAVDLARGRFLFAAGWWAAAVLAVWWRVGDDARRWRRLGPAFVAAVLLPVYLLTMSSAVGAADTFEFQVVAPQLGIAHPTGYPLYLLLGKLFSGLPLGTVAWRLNFASAVYATLAAAVVFRLALDLLRRPLPALVGALALGLVPVYWSQAIVAEVYTLHALIVAIALWLMVRLVAERGQRSTDRRKAVVALMFVIGLGLTNHLTSVFLLPPAALAVALRLLHDRQSGRRGLTVRPLMRVLPAAVAFFAPLLLYAYLPLRWRAVNGEAMGAARFVEWVAGGRFQGALQLMAWLRDPARWGIVGRLLLDAWGWLLLAVALVGLVWLLWREWRAAVVLALAGGGFAFYALNYYVPDLAVFLIAAHVVVAVFVAAGVAGVMAGVEEAHAKARRGEGREEESQAKTPRAQSSETEFFLRNSVSSVIFLLALLPIVAAAGGRWTAVDRSADDGGEPWGRGVLALPLARGAAVLADSEKIAPLYYLQQIEGLRPDLDIMVLPDEAAYRAELDARLAAGQAVYLARYLPGLAGVYHLRSMGPLVEVSREAVAELPAEATTSELSVGPLRLLGYVVEPVAAVDAGAAGVTLYWTLDRSLAEGEASPVVYLRWGEGGQAAGGTSGRHPVADSYPLNAWRAGEVVADFHLLPLSPGCERADGCAVDIEVAVAPRFTPAADLAWQTVTAVPVAPRPGPVGRPQRALFDGFALDGVDFPTAARPGAALPVGYSGHGPAAALSFLVVPTHAVNSIIGGSDAPPAVTVARSTAFAAAVEGAAETGPNVLIALGTVEPRAVCGWLRRPTTGCVVAELAVSGAPLTEGAVNFADRIALLDVVVDADSLTPGGQLPVTLTWQGLAEMDADYTVFVQVLDAADRLVGQVDAWPVQGTFPTSQWTPGETVVDPYLVQLSADLPPGDYRIHVGLYLLATGQRLPVVDESGAAIDDKVEIAIGRASP
ncbi:MAG: DUF2723 domain-containing protein [Candidatus Promineofilum sp.]|nr:DUF2723 domain-containing protein [Promineifilum sp.]